MSYLLRYDSIHVIESLRPGDLRTGEDLADHVTYGFQGLAVCFHKPSSKDALLQCLAGIATEARDGRHSPIVHIEAHGNEDGIEVTSGEFVSWSAMKSTLTAVNTASRLNLLVVMAACCGGNLVKILEPTNRAPVWALIGPTRDLTACEISTDFRGFYDELLGQRNGRRALERLNGAPVGQPWRYTFVPAQYFFRVVFYEYVNEMGTPDELTKREDALVRRIFESLGIEEEPTECRPRIRAALADHRMYFQFMRERFFMIDLFPENDQRFPLSYQECLRDPADDPDGSPTS